MKNKLEPFQRMFLLFVILYNIRTAKRMTARLTELIETTSAHEACCSCYMCHTTHALLKHANNQSQCYFLNQTPHLVFQSIL